MFKSSFILKIFTEGFTARICLDFLRDGGKKQ